MLCDYLLKQENGAMGVCISEDTLSHTKNLENQRFSTVFSFAQNKAHFFDSNFLLGVVDKHLGLDHSTPYNSVSYFDRSLSFFTENKFSMLTSNSQSNPFLSFAYGKGPLAKNYQLDTGPSPTKNEDIFYYREVKDFLIRNDMKSFLTENYIFQKEQKITSLTENPKQKVNVFSEAENCRKSKIFDILSPSRLLSMEFDPMKDKKNSENQRFSVMSQISDFRLFSAPLKKNDFSGAENIKSFFQLGFLPKNSKNLIGKTDLKNFLKKKDLIKKEKIRSYEDFLIRKGKDLSNSKNFDIQDSESSFLTNEKYKMTLEHELILFQSFWKFFKQHTFSKHFFPPRKSFLFYWLFPFIGFISLHLSFRANLNTYFTGNFLSIPNADNHRFVFNGAEVNNDQKAFLDKYGFDKPVHATHAQINHDINDFFIRENVFSKAENGRKSEIFDISWEAMEYLNYKKLLFDQSTKNLIQASLPLNNKEKEKKAKNVFSKAENGRKSEIFDIHVIFYQNIPLEKKFLQKLQQDEFNFNNLCEFFITKSSQFIYLPEMSKPSLMKKKMLMSKIKDFRPFSASLKTCDGEDITLAPLDIKSSFIHDLLPRKLDSFLIREVLSSARGGQKSKIFNVENQRFSTVFSEAKNIAFSKAEDNKFFCKQKSNESHFFGKISQSLIFKNMLSRSYINWQWYSWTPFLSTQNKLLHAHKNKFPFYEKIRNYFLLHYDPPNQSLERNKSSISKSIASWTYMTPMKASLEKDTNFENFQFSTIPSITSIINKNSTFLEDSSSARDFEKFIKVEDQKIFLEMTKTNQSCLELDEFPLKLMPSTSSFFKKFYKNPFVWLLKKESILPFSVSTHFSNKKVFTYNMSSHFQKRNCSHLQSMHALASASQSLPLLFCEPEGVPEHPTGAQIKQRQDKACTELHRITKNNNTKSTASREKRISFLTREVNPFLLSSLIKKDIFNIADMMYDRQSQIFDVSENYLVGIRKWNSNKFTSIHVENHSDSCFSSKKTLSMASEVDNRGFSLSSACRRSSNMKALLSTFNDSSSARNFIKNSGHQSSTKELSLSFFDVEKPLYKKALHLKKSYNVMSDRNSKRLKTLENQKFATLSSASLKTFEKQSFSTNCFLDTKICDNTLESFISNSCFVFKSPKKESISSACRRPSKALLSTFLIKKSSENPSFLIFDSYKKKRSLNYSPEQSYKKASVLLENEIKNLYFEKGILLCPDSLQKLNGWEKICFFNDFSIFTNSLYSSKLETSSPLSFSKTLNFSNNHPCKTIGDLSHGAKDLNDPNDPKPSIFDNGFERNKNDMSSACRRSSNMKALLSTLDVFSNTENDCKLETDKLIINLNGNVFSKAENGQKSFLDKYGLDKHCFTYFTDDMIFFNVGNQRFPIINDFFVFSFAENGQKSQTFDIKENKNKSKLLKIQNFRPSSAALKTLQKFLPLSSASRRSSNMKALLSTTFKTSSVLEKNLMSKNIYKKKSYPMHACPPQCQRQLALSNFKNVSDSLPMHAIKIKNECTEQQRITKNNKEQHDEKLFLKKTKTWDQSYFHWKPLYILFPHFQKSIQNRSLALGRDFDSMQSGIFYSVENKKQSDKWVLNICDDQDTSLNVFSSAENGRKSKIFDKSFFNVADKIDKKNYILIEPQKIRYLLSFVTSVTNDQFLIKPKTLFPSNLQKIKVFKYKYPIFMSGFEFPETLPEVEKHCISSLIKKDMIFRKKDMSKIRDFRPFSASLKINKVFISTRDSRKSTICNKKSAIFYQQSSALPDKMKIPFGLFATKYRILKSFKNYKVLRQKYPMFSAKLKTLRNQRFSTFLNDAKYIKKVLVSPTEKDTRKQKCSTVSSASRSHNLTKDLLSTFSKNDTVFSLAENSISLADDRFLSFMKEEILLPIDIQKKPEKSTNPSIRMPMHVFANQSMPLKMNALSVFSEAENRRKSMIFDNFKNVIPCKRKLVLASENTHRITKNNIEQQRTTMSPISDNVWQSQKHFYFQAKQNIFKRKFIKNVENPYNNMSSQDMSLSKNQCMHLQFNVFSRAENGRKSLIFDINKGDDFYHKNEQQNFLSFLDNGTISARDIVVEMLLKLKQNIEQISNIWFYYSYLFLQKFYQYLTIIKLNFYNILEQKYVKILDLDQNVEKHRFVFNLSNLKRTSQIVENHRFSDVFCKTSLIVSSEAENGRKSLIFDKKDINDQKAFLNVEKQSFSNVFNKKEKQTRSSSAYAEVIKIPLLNQTNSQLLKKYLIKSMEKRRIEKIFRTYLSCKYVFNKSMYSNAFDNQCKRELPSASQSLQRITKNHKSSSSPVFSFPEDRKMFFQERKNLFWKYEYKYVDSLIRIRNFMFYPSSRLVKTIKIPNKYVVSDVNDHYKKDIVKDKELHKKRNVSNLLTTTSNVESKAFDGLLQAEDKVGNVENQRFSTVFSSAENSVSNLKLSFSTIRDGVDIFVFNKIGFPCFSMRPFKLEKTYPYLMKNVTQNCILEKPITFSFSHFKNKKSLSSASRRQSKALHINMTPRFTPNLLLKRVHFLFFTPVINLSNVFSKAEDSRKALLFDISEDHRINVKKHIIKKGFTFKPMHAFAGTEPQDLFSLIKSNHLNDFFIRENNIRLQKCKNIQKKRRRKKQKRETRRRKKRKRFFPRPVWLRFRLYKQLLKTRNYRYVKNRSVENQRSLVINDFSFAENNDVYNNPMSSARRRSSKTKALLSTSGKPFVLKLENDIASDIIRDPRKSTIVDNNQITNVESKAFILEDLLHAEDKFFKFPTLLVVKKMDNSFPQAKEKRFHTGRILKINIHKKNLRKKIYRNNKQNWGYCFYDNDKFINLRNSNLIVPSNFPISTDRQFFQISNTVLGDFKRLFWKSNWLRSRLYPYINRVNSYLEKIQDSYRQWHFLNTLKNYLLNIVGFNYQLKDFYNLSKTNISLYHPNFLILKKSPQPLWYINIKNSFDNMAWSSSHVNSPQYLRTIQFFEYNRILYQRLQDIIKNIKQNLSIDGQNQSRSSNPGRKKHEKIIFKNLWIRLGRLISLETPTSPIKSMGEITKLRIFWALSKTNTLSFKENNNLKTLWTNVKKREQSKSNNTKKLINKIWSINMLSEKDLKTLNVENREFSTVFRNNSYSDNNCPKQSFGHIMTSARRRHGNQIFQKFLLAEYRLSSTVGASQLSIKDSNVETFLIKENVFSAAENGRKSKIFDNNLIKNVKNNSKLYLMYFSKVRNKQQKLNNLGLKEKNYKNYLLNLKRKYKTYFFDLSKCQKHMHSLVPTKGNVEHFISNVENQRFSTVFSSAENNVESKAFDGLLHAEDISQKSIHYNNSVKVPKVNHAKRSFYFWWSMSAPNFKLINFSIEDFSFFFESLIMSKSPIVIKDDLHLNQCIHSHAFDNLCKRELASANQSLHGITKNDKTRSYVHTNTFMGMILAPLKTFTPFTIWIFVILIHVCILFSLIRISEIRTLMKCFLLIIYKIINSYIICIYFIFDFLKNYKEKAKICLLNNFSRVYAGSQNSWYDPHVFSKAENGRKSSGIFRLFDITKEKNNYVVFTNNKSSASVELDKGKNISTTSNSFKNEQIISKVQLSGMSSFTSFNSTREMSSSDIEVPMHALAFVEKQRDVENQRFSTVFSSAENINNTFLIKNDMLFKKVLSETSQIRKDLIISKSHKKSDFENQRFSTVFSSAENIEDKTENVFTLSNSVKSNSFKKDLIINVESKAFDGLLHAEDKIELFDISNFFKKSQKTLSFLNKRQSFVSLNKEKKLVNTFKPTITTNLTADYKYIFKSKTNEIVSYPGSYWFKASTDKSRTKIVSTNKNLSNFKKEFDIISKENLKFSPFFSNTNASHNYIYSDTVDGDDFIKKEIMSQIRDFRQFSAPLKTNDPTSKIFPENFISAKNSMILVTKKSKSSMLGTIYRIPMFIKNSKKFLKKLSAESVQKDENLLFYAIPYLKSFVHSTINNVFSEAENGQKSKIFDKQRMFYSFFNKSQKSLISQITPPLFSAKLKTVENQRFSTSEFISKNVENQRFSTIFSFAENKRFLLKNSLQFLQSSIIKNVESKAFILDDLQHAEDFFKIRQKNLKFSAENGRKSKIFDNFNFSTERVILLKQKKKSYFLIFSSSLAKLNFFIFFKNLIQSFITLFIIIIPLSLAKLTTIANIRFATLVKKEWLSFHSLSSAALNEQTPLYNDFMMKKNLFSAELKTSANHLSLSKIRDFRPFSASLKTLEFILLRYKSFISFSLYITIKFLFQFLNRILIIGYTTVIKCIDILENFMFIIYKFLEKPAELMIEWIAQIFLVEWTADTLTYVPETADIYIWSSFQKFSRNIRIFGITGNFAQRRLWCLFEVFMELIAKPDVDILLRQKRGILFWDIWAEILIQAAEKYNINISSLTSLKEEQELLIENLLKDSNWYWSRPLLLEMTPLLKMTQVSVVNSCPNSKELRTVENKPLVSFLNRNGQSTKWLLANFQTSQEKKFSTLSSASRRQSKALLSTEENNVVSGAENNRKSLIFNMTSLKNMSKSLKIQDDFRPFSALLKTFSSHKHLSNSSLATVYYTEGKDLIKNENEEKWRRWSANQYFTYQGKDTDLFIDIHLPKNFRHLNVIKYYESINQPLGNLVCQIYSGIFSKQVAKNILIVGAPGSGKTMFIQAMAGETELKIIIDNANRYALVLRGVAVGMKLLRDVFDGIAMHTPCLFLMEDIHIIGERRPLLISDDENVKATDSSMGFEREEVHERNQVIYQLSKHSITHFKKPYKGDFSLLISTNHYCFDLFLGVSPPRARKNQITSSHPLPLTFISSELIKQNESNVNGKNIISQFQKQENKIEIPEILETSLQLSSEKLFAPPSTSPFTILVLKQQKKLKSRKLVKQLPWGGLSMDQMMLIPKIVYSIKVKIALLAEIAISNLTVKLDIITDLLIIIDSVRANRGFVVFATTHIPYVLDPALRRPGRLDETISLPLYPNLLCRWEILKSFLGNLVQNNTIDLVDYVIFSKNFNEMELINLTTRAKLILCAPLNVFSKAENGRKSMIYDIKNSLSSLSEHNRTSVFSGTSVNIFSHKEKQEFSNKLITKRINHSVENHKFTDDINDYFISENIDKIANRGYLSKERLKMLVKKRSKEISTLLKRLLVNSNVIETSITKQLKNFENVKTMSSAKLKTVENQRFSTSSSYLIKKDLKRISNETSIKNDSNIKRFKYYPFISSGPSNFLAIAYYQVSKFLIQTQFIKDQTCFQFILWTKCSEISTKNQGYADDLSFTTLYSSNYDFMNQILKLFAGKIGEFFIFSTWFPLYGKIENQEFTNVFSKTEVVNNPKVFLDKNGFDNYDIVENQRFSTVFSSAENNDFFSSLEDKGSISEFSKQKQYSFNGLWSFYGIDKMWRSATSLIYSLMQKRYLYSKHLLISRLLYIQNNTSLKDPPSPSATNILTPAKRFENYKRNEKDYNKKPFISINEKIHFHQQQRLIKNLYNQPVNEYFRSEVTSTRYTSFNTSFRELLHLDSFTRKFSSINSLYRNKILIRHKYYLTNQWWNGQLAEQNAETTYLSDVDWRYNYLESVGDVIVDFPDADQYYNPRMRRWVLTSGYWGDWDHLEKTMNYDIYYHFVQEQFNGAYNFLSNHREVLDYLAFIFMKNGILKEIDLIQSLERFVEK